MKPETVPVIGIVGCLIAGAMMGENPNAANTNEPTTYTQNTESTYNTLGYYIEKGTDIISDVFSNTDTSDYSTDYDTTYSDTYDYEEPEYFNNRGEGYYPQDKNLEQYMINISNNFGVPPELTFAICYMESNFIANINNEGLNTNGTIDYGIMGLNGAYLQNFCDMYNNGQMIDVYNAYDNIYIGVQILANMYNYWGGSIYDTACSYQLGIAGWEDMKYSGDGQWYYGDKVLDYIYNIYY